MKKYAEVHLWDYIFTLLISVGFSINAFSAFQINETYLTNYLLVAAIAAVTNLLMFIAGFSKNNTLIGSGIAVVAVIAWALFLRAQGMLNMNDKVDKSMPFVITITVFVTAITFIFSRKKKALLIFVPILTMLVGAFAFLEYPVNVPLYILMVVGLILEVLYSTFLDSVLSASYGGYNMPHFITQAIAIAMVIVVAGSGVYYGIVKPLDPPTKDIKLITRYLSFDVLEKVGAAWTQELPNKNNKTNNTNNSNKNTRNENKNNNNNKNQNQKKNNKNNKQNNNSQTVDSDKTLIAQAISYQTQDMTAAMLAFMLAALLLIPWLIKYLIRMRRINSYEKMAPEKYVVSMYNFFMKSFRRLRIGNKGTLTVLEYPKAYKFELEDYDSKNGVTFEKLSETYNKLVYAGVKPTDEEVKEFRDYYQSFYKNVKHNIGSFKYAFKFWIL